MRELRSKYIVGRKSHPCVWCGEKIKVGEESKYRVYISRRSLRAEYAHLECEGAQDEYMKESDIYTIEEGYEEGFFKRGTTEPR